VVAQPNSVDKDFSLYTYCMQYIPKRMHKILCIDTICVMVMQV